MPLSGFIILSSSFSIQVILVKRVDLIKLRLLLQECKKNYIFIHLFPHEN